MWIAANCFPQIQPSIHNEIKKVGKWVGQLIVSSGQFIANNDSSVISD